MLPDGCYMALLSSYQARQVDMLGRKHCMPCYRLRYTIPLPLRKCTWERAGRSREFVVVTKMNERSGEKAKTFPVRSRGAIPLPPLVGAVRAAEHPQVARRYKETTEVVSYLGFMVFEKGLSNISKEQVVQYDPNF